MEIAAKSASSADDASHQRASFLASAGTVLLSLPLEVDETLARVPDLAVPAIADWCVIEIPDEHRMQIAHVDPAMVELTHAMRRRYPPPVDAPYGVHNVLRTAQAELYTEVSEAVLEASAHDADHLRMVKQIGIESVMVVPMTARGRTFGVITFVATERSGRRYVADDLEMASRFAQKAALAIENARLFAQERNTRAAIERAADRMQRLQALTSDLAKALTTEQVAQVVIDHSAGGVGARTAAIWSLDANAKTARMLRSWNYPEQSNERYASIDMSSSAPIAEAIRNREPIFIDSIQEYARRFPESAQRVEEDLRHVERMSLACLPLVVGDVALGALAFALRSDRDVDESERAFLTLAAGHCAQGLYRARIYEAERRARSEMALLYELVDAVARADTVDEVYELALTSLELALDVKRTSVLLFDADGVMRFKASHGLSEKYRAAVEGHSPWSRDTRGATTIVVPDVANDASLEKFLPVFREEGIAALVFVPLIHQHRLLGKFMIYSEVPRELSNADLAMARSVAVQVAQAVTRKLAETEIARLYAEANEARAEAEGASRMKDEFLAVVSHELRTPMSAILGWSHILRSDRRSEPGMLVKGLDVIERNARAQTKIVEDILDVSRIVTGKLVLDPRPISLVTVIADALDVVRPPAQAKDIFVDFLPSEDPFVIVGDSERLRQIVWNLLSNAIKFTPRGGRVAIVLERAREQSAISIRVQDNGKGISPEFLPHVFERFRQADSTTTRAQGGLGLGLAIVRHLAELHGGIAHAASEGADRGATFTVTLPVRALFNGSSSGDGLARFERGTGSTRRPTPGRIVLSLQGVRVLVVDDEIDAREMLNQALTSYGALVQVVPSARAALLALTEYQPHVLVSDIGMPIEDGYALIQRVRELPTAQRSVSAIALTAYARPEERKRAIDAGYDEHLAKPTDPATLATLIASMVPANVA